MTRIERLIESQTYAIDLVDKKVKSCKDKTKLEVLKGHYTRLTHIRLCLINFNSQQETNS